jgi:hypothetical protein
MSVWECGAVVTGVSPVAAAVKRWTGVRRDHAVTRIQPLFIDVALTLCPD